MKECLHLHIFKHKGKLRGVKSVRPSMPTTKHPRGVIRYLRCFQKSFLVWPCTSENTVMKTKSAFARNGRSTDRMLP